MIITLNMFISTAVVVVLTNILYQAITKRDWDSAAERSYFQLVVITTLYFMAMAMNG